MNKYPMTTQGFAMLESELKKLKTVDRHRISKAIGEARELGDLKENAEYHAAREQQSFIEGRIQDIEAKLSAAVVVDLDAIKTKNKILFGATVTLENMANGESVVYKIVGEDEADISLHKISVTSPIARALIGKELEDVVTVKAPKGIDEYEILAIEYK